MSLGVDGWMDGGREGSKAGLYYHGDVWDRVRVEDLL